MTGMELSRRYYAELVRPALARGCPELLPRIAAGLAGEGSECFGYDDELSRDHDWGPGLCLWLTDGDYERFGARAREIYAALPKEYLGCVRRREDPLSAGRVGVLRIGEFYERFLGSPTPPRTAGEWLSASDAALAACTNGAVFEDNAGEFTAVREELQAYYPESIRRKRLAARCALTAQAGQYNFPRCLKRGDAVAALRALGEFIDHAQAALFLLEKRYRPYYKWAHRALRDLPCGAEAAPLFERLAAAPTEQLTEPIEAICARIVHMLAEQELSAEPGDFLLPHARAVQASIQNDGIREMPLLSFP